MTRTRAVLVAVLLGVCALVVAPATGATAPRTAFGLASVGSDGTPANADTSQPALSADGDHVAFVSPATLAVTASVPQTPPSEETGEADRIYVHDRLTGATTLLSDAGAGDATAPTVSGDGGVVAYQSTPVDDPVSQIDVVSGLTVAQVTGNSGDPHYQRVPQCPVFATGCGPHLSADGGTLVYPAVLSPVSPTFPMFANQEFPTGNVVDVLPSTTMTSGGATGIGQFVVNLDYQNTGRVPIELTGPPTVSGPFELIGFQCGTVTSDALRPQDTPAASLITVDPGESCTSSVLFDAGDACDNPGIQAGDLITDATTPDGQTDQELVAACAPSSVFTSGAPAPPPPSSSPSCPALPPGLAVRPAPEETTDNQGTPLVDAGPIEVGEPVLESMPVTGNGTLAFGAPDCSVQLVAPPNQPDPCVQGEILGDERPGCTAYFLLTPTEVGTRAGLLTVGDQFEQIRSTYVSFTGQRSVIVARHGPAFAQGTVVSVDGTGAPVPGAVTPSVSADGGTVVFAGNGGVWQANGGLIVPGAVAPAVSGDGSTVAYVAAGQVEVRTPTRTVRIGAGQHPALSQDGSTVAFEAGSGVDVAQVGSGPEGVATGSSPALDAHGRVLALSSGQALVPTAPSDVDSTYTFERFDQIQVNPTSVGYGRLIAGLPGQTRTVTVTDTGLGPTVVTGVTIGGPYVLVTNTCLGTVLHSGQSCQLIVLLTPTTAGNPAGTLTITTADDGEPPETTRIGLTATVVNPTAPILVVHPTVASGGQVVHVTGAAFAAGEQLTLSWNPGLGDTVTTTNGSGALSANMVIFPDDLLGIRSLVATDVTGKVVATLPFLVEANPVEPPFHK